MALACLARCPMTKCRRFFQCEEHWMPEELAEMRHITPEEAAEFNKPAPAEAVAPQIPPTRRRPDWVEPEFEQQ